MNKQILIISGVLVAMVAAVMLIVGVGKPVVTQHSTPTAAKPDYLRATYDPLHFKPAIETATDAQCLACHKEILEDRVRTTAPAGVKAVDSLAWYQQVSTYQGEQDSFHRRHLVTPLAQQLMKLQCNTCHEGHDPREEAPGAAADAPAQSDTGFTLRKQVNPETSCLKCHGQMPAKEIMGLPGAWPEVKDTFQNDCLTCHAVFRTNRHQVSYLNAQAIEEAAKAGQATKTGADVCYGCHGGRPWYRIAYPYSRNPWPNMAAETPEWAKHRPNRSEARFLNSANLNRFLQPTP
ncbi:MAG: cytochrome c3 family protein [Rhodocyclaceae bacterium]|nr:cytochrome c3 family protein [Rhodocyclaceae bacterium]